MLRYLYGKAETMYTPRGMKIFTFDTPRKCTICETQIPKNIPVMMLVHSGGELATNNFKVCPQCLQAVSITLLDKLETCSEEIKEKYITKRFTKML